MVYSDDFLEAYNVPQFETLVPFLTVGEGWGEREVGPNGTFRWMGHEAELVTQSTVAQTAYLTFRIAGLGPERTLRIYHGSIQIFDEKVGALREVRLGPLDLPPGKSTLRFVSPEGTVSPADLGDPGDPRELSFAILDAKLEAEGPSGMYTRPQQGKRQAGVDN